MKMKRLWWLAAALLLAALALPLQAGAEEALAAPGQYTLPIDMTGGKKPLESGYTGDETYIDPTIRVSIETGRVNDTDYWIADIQVADASQLRTASAAGFNAEAEISMARLANRMNAVLAINGDYYCYTGYGYILRQGQAYLHRLAGLRDVLLIDEDGDFHFVKKAKNADVSDTIDGKRVINAFYFGPVLYADGRIGTGFDDYEVSWVMAGDWTAQRVAICQAGKLHYKVVVTTGPFRGSTGMTMREFAQFVAQQDVICAYNLDGGNSAALYFHGKKINDPDNPDLRDLVDIIYFASAWEE